MYINCKRMCKCVCVRASACVHIYTSVKALWFNIISRSARWLFTSAWVLLAYYIMYNYCMKNEWFEGLNVRWDCMLNLLPFENSLFILLFLDPFLSLLSFSVCCGLILIFDTAHFISVIFAASFKCLSV